MAGNKDGKIVLYTTDDGKAAVSVLYDNETFWMNQKALAELFCVDRSVIAKHLRAIYSEGELSREATCAKIAQVQTEGGRLIKLFPKWK
jgi:hypothetical protein